MAATLSAGTWARCGGGRQGEVQVPSPTSGPDPLRAGCGLEDLDIDCCCRCLEVARELESRPRHHPRSHAAAALPPGQIRSRDLLGATDTCRANLHQSQPVVADPRRRRRGWATEEEPRSPRRIVVSDGSFRQRRRAGNELLPSFLVFVRF